MTGDDVIVYCELGHFIDREECFAARQLEANQECDERDQHRDGGPNQVEEIERGYLACRIWRDKRPTMLAAELSEIKPKTEASFQCTRGVERSPPLSVILNGRPNGLMTALSSVAEIAKAVTAWVASINNGSMRDLEIQAMYMI